MTFYLVVMTTIIYVKKDTRLDHKLKVYNIPHSTTLRPFLTETLDTSCGKSLPYKIPWGAAAMAMEVLKIILSI
jgi:hypothetical protein